MFQLCELNLFVLFSCSAVALQAGLRADVDAANARIRVLTADKNTLTAEKVPPITVLLHAMFTCSMHGSPVSMAFAPLSLHRDALLTPMRKLSLLK